MIYMWQCITYMIPQLPLPKNINEKDDKGCNDASSPLYNLSYSIQQEREELAGNLQAMGDKWSPSSLFDIAQ